MGCCTEDDLFTDDEASTYTPRLLRACRELSKNMGCRSLGELSTFAVASPELSTGHQEACYTIEALLSLRARPATCGSRIIRQVWIPAFLLDADTDSPDPPPEVCKDLDLVRLPVAEAHAKQASTEEDVKVRADADRLEARAAMRAEARAARAKDKAAAQALQASDLAAAERARGSDLLKELLRLPTSATTASACGVEPRPRSPLVAQDGEACRSSLNARAAEFVPSTAVWRQPLAFVPTAPPMRTILSGPDIFSMEEQKLLGLQLCEELGGLVGDTSPGSARTSYGTERETGEETDEDELRAKALALRATMFSIAPR